MSGIRRMTRPPLWARNRWMFLRWCHRQTRSHAFGSMGPGSVVYPPALIDGHRHIHLGRDVVVHPGAVLSVVDEHAGERYQPRLVIGDGVRIGADMVIGCCGSIEIGDRVLTADRVFIGDTYHEYRDAGRAVVDQGLRDPRPVRIGAGAFLGINCAILPGVTLGEGAYVAANAVVTQDVPAHTLVVGNPARVARRWDGEAWVDAG